MHLAQLPDLFSDDLDYRTSNLPMGSGSGSSTYDSLDDVFGPGPDATTQTATDVSLDTQRLRAQHNTVGYREGITTGKAGSMQAGFDQGFALGANIGMRAGQILGLLDGFRAAVTEAEAEAEAEARLADESARIHALFSRAVAELQPDNLFTPEFWAPDGTWTYSVTASRAGGEITYLDVAEQHPLLAKWESITCEETSKWNVDRALSILESDGASVRDDEVRGTGNPSIVDRTPRDAIQW
ncbi:hypothetical protein F4777DRAFT_583929 [Nemania sp. FL0916]|nr:hypothetical protein F4777DRAFT_583929 [Nemania sp. FL0916]